MFKKKKCSVMRHKITQLKAGLEIALSLSIPRVLFS